MPCCPRPATSMSSAWSARTWIRPTASTIPRTTSPPIRCGASWPTSWAGSAGYALAQESDRNKGAPGTGLFERIIGDRPTLIMIDEIARHLRAAVAMPTATGQIQPGRADGGLSDVADGVRGQPEAGGAGADHGQRCRCLSPGDAGAAPGAGRVAARSRPGRSGC